MSELQRPLEGVKIVEMATFIAAPAVGRILADLGAEVIKVEAPMGDALRFTAVNEGRPLYNTVRPKKRYNEVHAVDWFRPFRFRQETGSRRLQPQS
jgi:crotonobetainyl-CoA:carnitine CoA-transferase CaiB-like acyl-CoA transferase